MCRVSGLCGSAGMVSGRRKIRRCWALGLEAPDGFMVLVQQSYKSNVSRDDGRDARQFIQGSFSSARGYPYVPLVSYTSHDSASSFLYSS